MFPVDSAKTKQLLLDFSRPSIRTDNIILATQHAQKQGYLTSDETLTKFESTFASFLGFNSELIDRTNYGY